MYGFECWTLCEHSFQWMHKIRWKNKKRNSLIQSWPLIIIEKIYRCVSESLCVCVCDDGKLIFLIEAFCSTRLSSCLHSIVDYFRFFQQKEKGYFHLSIARSFGFYLTKSNGKREKGNACIEYNSSNSSARIEAKRGQSLILSSKILWAESSIG